MATEAKSAKTTRTTTPKLATTRSTVAKTTAKTAVKAATTKTAQTKAKAATNRSTATRSARSTTRSVKAPAVAKDTVRTTKSLRSEVAHSTPRVATMATEDWRHMVAEAAYFKAQARGFANGSPVEDWLAAESEIEHQVGRSTAQQV